MKNCEITIFDENEKVIKTEVIESESKYSLKRAARVKVKQTEGGSSYSLRGLNNEKN